MITGAYQRIVRYFLTGILALLPLVLTAGVLAWVWGFLKDFVGPDSYVGEALSQIGSQIWVGTPLAYLVGWSVVLMIVLLLGFLLEMGAKRFFTSRLDALAKRVPVIGTVYGTASQLVQMLDTKSDNEMKQMSVVYCKFGKDSGGMFLALQPTSQRFRVKDMDYVAVLIPTAPVPFGGGLVFVPADCVWPADNVSIDSLMSIYVSMGVSAPEFMQKSENAEEPAKNAPEITSDESDVSTDQK